MDYKELANLIFPDAKDISYYEEKYPERNLPEGAIVTRFAPSLFRSYRRIISIIGSNNGC